MLDLNVSILELYVSTSTVEYQSLHCRNHIRKRAHFSLVAKYMFGEVSVSQYSLLLFIK